MINWYYFVAIACIIAVFLFYKEWTRKKRTYLFGRLLATLLAIVSLLLLAYPYAGNNETAANKLLLLTNGFIKDSVEIFLQQNKNIPVYSIAEEDKKLRIGVKTIVDLKIFSAKHSTDTIHVFGNGFSNEELTALNSHSIIFHSPASKPAITSVYWKQTIETGEQLIVQGKYDNSSTQKIKIVLQAFGTNKDSILIPAGMQQSFQLSTTPLHTGNAVYNLIVENGNDTLQKEPVPVNVQAIKPLQLLMISASPDFDNTYLKNHLSQQGYQVTTITTVSTNKTDRQFLNTTAQQGANKLTSTYLEKFDVLITDQDALQKMTTAENAAIRSAIREKGIGLIVKTDAEHSTAFYASSFPIKKLPQGKEPFVMLHSTYADSNQFKIRLTDPFSIVHANGTQILLHDKQANIYAASSLYGSGKIVATTLQNSFSIALAGDKAAYQQLWWLLLNKAAKKIDADENWRSSPFIAFANKPVQMQVEKNDTAIAKAFAGQTALYLEKDSLLPFLYRGIYWPYQSGWQLMPAISTAPANWYVYKPGDWQLLTDHQRIAETKKYAATHTIANNTETSKEISKPLNIRLYLFIVFLLSCIFLWAEQKLG